MKDPALRWREMIDSLETATVLCFSSAESYLLDTAAQKVIAELQQKWGNSEVTRIDGPMPSVEEIVLAGGTISFFSTRRIIYLRHLETTAFGDVEMKEFCDNLQSVENAFFVITVLQKKENNGKFPPKKTKKALLLENTARQCGSFQELTAPNGGGLQKFVQELAAQYGADISSETARLLIETAGDDLYLLDQEAAKLAAGCGYREITPKTVNELASRSIEADAFEMVRDITSNRPADAFAVLSRLLALKNDPIAIAAAVNSSFVDLARVKTAAQEKVGYAAVFGDFGYHGSDYRLKKSSETASFYTQKQLAESLDLLVRLDRELKSSPVDSEVLLEVTLGQLCAVKRRG